MPDSPEKFITGTIDDYLLALADGMVKAQTELNKVSVQVAPGQPAVSYHLPKLDFELKMTFSLERESESETVPRRASPVHVSGLKIPLLKATPINPETTSETFSANAVSTIKGSFIALPANGGKPPNILGLSVVAAEKTSLQVLVSLRNAVGEPIVNQPVAVSVDRDFSKSLNTERGIAASKRELRPTTDFEEAEVYTNEDGEAFAKLNIAPEEDRRVTIVIEASSGNLSDAIIYQAS